MSIAIAAGIHEICLAVGFEKLKDEGMSGLPGMENRTNTHYQSSMPGVFAMMATRYFNRYGLSPQEGKTMLAKISIKSHHNGSLNPKAHLRREVTLEQVINAPIIAWPLGLLDCCGVTDGAAAAIICRAEDAKTFREDYVLIKGFGLAVGPGQGGIRIDYDYTHWDETEWAAKEVYAQAGIENPRRELNLAEVHDAFSISELIAAESLGICERG